VSAIDSNERTVWIADAHRDEGKRFIVRAEWSMPRFLASLQSCVYHWAAPIVMRESTL
jgi:hypothetical protein